MKLLFNPKANLPWVQWDWKNFSLFIWSKNCTEIQNNRISNPYSKHWYPSKCGWVWLYIRYCNYAFKPTRIQFLRHEQFYRYMDPLVIAFLGCDSTFFFSCHQELALCTTRRNIKKAGAKKTQRPKHLTEFVCWKGRVGTRWDWLYSCRTQMTRLNGCSLIEEKISDMIY